MVKSKIPTKHTMRKHRSLNPSAQKQEKTLINQYLTAPKPVKTHNNIPNLETSQKNQHPRVKKPVKTPKHNPSSEKPPKKQSPHAQNPEKTPKSSPKIEKQKSWASFRSIISCKHLQVQTQSEHKQKGEGNGNKMSKKMRCSGSLCNNTKVMQRPEPSSSFSSISVNNGGESSNSTRSMKSPLRNGALVSSASSSFMVMPFRRFSGCYECRMVVDPVLGFTRDPSLRATICTCPQCGEIFMKAENLELHLAVRHAVSELGAEDTSKNIVEIIFQSSWLKKQTPVCKIDRILKVQNTPRTISKFEVYRDSIKTRSSSSTSSSHHHQRCLADGNELLRFHATSLLCSLGIDGSSNLCGFMPNCHVCSIIKNGFKKISGPRGAGGTRGGILTTATSGRAHDSAEVAEGEKETRAMLVCRVIAGRVRKEGASDDNVATAEEEGEYDSVAGAAGAYSNLDELYVFSPRAILPCFVVVYRGF